MKFRRLLQSDGPPRRAAHHFAMPSFVRRTCTDGARMLWSTLHQTCGPAAASPTPGRHADVQGVRRQRAAPAALALPLRQRCALGARLAPGRSRERMREAKSPGCREGQIKGTARRTPKCQSARGLGAAPRGISRVPCRHGYPRGRGVCLVPFTTDCVPGRSELCHGRT